MKNLSPAEVEAMIASDAEQPLLLDVREPWELAICQISRSVSIPMGQIPARLGELERDRPLVAICHHGIRSYQVARFLEHRGFARVVNLDGGIGAWARDLDPEMPTY